MIHFERDVLIPLPIDEAFVLSLSIDAHVGSMAGSHERAVAGIQSGTIGRGESVTWKARHFGITWTMTSVITEWDRPHMFVDEQRRGPFKSFHHHHTFRPAAGGTAVHDDVTFEAPLGPLGKIAEQLVLKRYLPHLIDVRNAFLITEARRR